MTIPALFAILVQAFHHDATSEQVDFLAAEFTARVAHELYTHGGSCLLLTVIPARALSRYVNVHLLLTSYGFCLTRQYRTSQGVCVIGVTRTRVRSAFPEEQVQVRALANQEVTS